MIQDQFQSRNKGVFPGFNLPACVIIKSKQPTDNHVIRENRWLLSIFLNGRAKWQIGTIMTIPKIQGLGFTSGWDGDQNAYQAFSFQEDGAAWLFEEFCRTLKNPRRFKQRNESTVREGERAA